MSQARLFAQLIAQLAPEIHRAFMASVTDLQSNVDWAALLGALSRFDMEAAVFALNINEAAWAEYSAAVTSAYARAGASTAAQIMEMGIGPVGTRFRMTNPRALDWIQRNVAESVVGFTREATETARFVIGAGYARGDGPQTIAVDLAGRVRGGTRAGGVVGLDRPRAERLNIVSSRMRTAEGVQSLVVRHEDGTLGVRYKVNAATQQRILRAYAAETAVPEADRAISERQYSNALLKARADTVAATETGNAVLSARQEEWRQLAESQGLDASAVRKTWQHRRGYRDGRPTHIEMSGVTVVGLDTPFVLSDGSAMQHPHDVNGGARNNINCGCDCTYSLDHSAGLE